MIHRPLRIGSWQDPIVTLSTPSTELSWFLDLEYPVVGVEFHMRFSVVSTVVEDPSKSDKISVLVPCPSKTSDTSLGLWEK